MKDEKIKTVRKSKLIKFYRGLFNGRALLGEKMGGKYDDPVSLQIETIKQIIAIKGRIDIPEQNRYILKFIKELKDWGWFILGE